MNTVILGALWGDEGKGAVVHHLSKNFDWVIRFNGGANSGHTIYRDRVKYVHSLLPSADFRNEKIKCFLGSGMVIDPNQLLGEIVEASRTFPKVGERIYVDPDVVIVTQEHKDHDRRKNGHIGTTNRGIGPAYVSKVSRSAVRLRNVDPDEDVIAHLRHYGVKFMTPLDLKEELLNSNLLFEGAQGVMLDVNHGTYPFVTSCDCTVGGVLASGFGFVGIGEILGVTKCYVTRVGEGPFPTEATDIRVAGMIREVGHEYGAVTGRDRRVGWLDLPALRYACEKTGISGLVLTKNDILAKVDEEIPVCIGYDKTPTSFSDFFDAKPKYLTVYPWEKADLSDESFRTFIGLIESYVGVPVKYVTDGVDENSFRSLET